MGADVYWNKSPLNGEVGDAEIEAVMRWAKPQGDNPKAAAALHSDWGIAIHAALIFRVAEGLGHYFRANMHNWPDIVAEMRWRRMLGDDVIPAVRVEGNGNGKPVTPEQIFKALDADTHPILPLLTISADDNEASSIPGLWVRWLCFMERAAELGDGFTVS